MASVLGNQYIAPFVAAIVLWLVSLAWFSVWTFFFAFLLSWVIASWVVKLFANRGKRLGSRGRYARGGEVYLAFVVGIVFASWAGSEASAELIGALNSTDSLPLFVLNLAAAWILFYQMKRGD